MTTITVQTPTTISTPRGAAWIAGLTYSLFSAFGRLIKRAQAAQAAREERAMRSHSFLCVGDPRQVRAYAQSVMRYDARFAADLYAAADRHERFGRWT